MDDTDEKPAPRRCKATASLPIACALEQHDDETPHHFEGSLTWADDPAPEPAPPPASGAIQVDVVVIGGQRNVRLLVPNGDKTVAAVFTPDMATAFAKVLATQAGVARSGLILPG